MGPPFLPNPSIVVPPPSLLRNCDREVGPVSGVEEARRDAVEVVRGCPLARPEGPRALARDVAKGAPEGSEALPPRPERNLRDGQDRVAQHGRGPLDPPREEVPVRWHPEG